MFYLTLSHLTCKCHAGKYPYCDGGRGMPMVEYDESVIFFVSIGMMSRFLERFYLLPALEFSRFIRSCGQKMQAYPREHIKAADKWKTIASWCRGVESSSAQHEGLGELIPINMWLILQVSWQVILRLSTSAVESTNISDLSFRYGPLWRCLR